MSKDNMSKESMGSKDGNVNSESKVSRESRVNVVNGIAVVLAFILGVGVTMIVYSIVTGLVQVGSLNGEVITRADLNDYVNMRMNSLAFNYIEDKIHEDALKELGITVNQDEIDERVNEVTERNGGIDAFREELESVGNSLETYRYNVGKTILSEKANEYFSDKAVVTKEDVERTFNEKKAEGNEIALMDVTEVELADDETDENIDFSKVDKNKIKTEIGVLTSTVFKEIPEVGSTASVVINNKRTVVRVDKTYCGVDDSVVYEYIEKELKEAQGKQDYAKYIDDKTDSADIRLK